MTVTPLASGSSGNSLLVSGAGTHILIDAGISCRRITTALKELNIDPSELTGILITHEHSDHVCGLTTLLKKFRMPVYASVGTASCLCRGMGLPEERLRPVTAGSSFQVGALSCTSFSTSHDAADSVGYTVELNGEKMALATDLGHVTDIVRRAVLGSALVVLESNHDEDWLRSGPYPYSLKQRILGERGHLSNEVGADLAAQAVQAGAHTVILAHLSRENNTPVRARDVACRRLCALGIDPERDIRLEVAAPDRTGSTFAVGREGAPC